MTRTPVPSIVPIPSVDADPDPGNEVGGTDAVEEDTVTPPVTPDVPLSAQMTNDQVPDEIQQPEKPDSEANVENPSAEPSA
ncbi:MAG: hypothetical protein JWR52_3577 [Marmoricola sp.]|nr:hypothetical protein [Marmoricola sp.]